MSTTDKKTKKPDASDPLKLSSDKKKDPKAKKGNASKKDDAQEAVWDDSAANPAEEEESKEEEEEEEEYEVELITDKKIKRGTVLYLVKWKNYSMDYATWEPQENLENAPMKIRDYENQLLAQAAESATKKKSKEEVTDPAKSISKNSNDAAVAPSVSASSETGSVLGKRPADDNEASKAGDINEKKNGKKKKNEQKEDDDGEVVGKDTGYKKLHTEDKQPQAQDQRNKQVTLNHLAPNLTATHPIYKPTIQHILHSTGIDKVDNGIDDLPKPVGAIIEKNPYLKQSGDNKGLRENGISLSTIMQNDQLIGLPGTESINKTNGISSEKKDGGSDFSKSTPMSMTKTKRSKRGENGSIDKGDIPVKVIGIRPVKEVNDLEIMVSWKPRENGVKPYDSKVMRIDLLKHGFWMPLIEFYESKMKLESAPNFDPALLPKC